MCTHTHTHFAQSLLFLPLIQSLEMSFSVPCTPLFYKVQAFWCPWLTSEMLVSGSPGAKATCQSRSHRFDLWWRKLPYAVEQLLLGTTTTELVLWSPGAATTERTSCSYWRPCPQSPRSEAGKATAMRSTCPATREQPCSRELEKKLVKQQRSSMAK